MCALGFAGPSARSVAFVSLSFCFLLRLLPLLLLLLFCFTGAGAGCDGAAAFCVAMLERTIRNADVGVWCQ